MTNTTNTNQQDPVEGGSYDTWGDILDANRQIVDKAFGSKTTIGATGGVYNLTQDESNFAAIRFNGALTDDLVVQTLNGKSRYWFIYNATTGPHDVIMQVAGSTGLAVTLEQGKISIVMADGTDCSIIDLSTLSGTLPLDFVTFANMQLINPMKVMGNVGATPANPAEVDILNDDTFAADRADALTSQRSTKRWVNSKIAGKITISTDLPSGGQDNDIWLRILP